MRLSYIFDGQSDQFDRLSDQFDRLSVLFDRLSDQFDRLSDLCDGLWHDDGGREKRLRPTPVQLHYRGRLPARRRSSLTQLILRRRVISSVLVSIASLSASTMLAAIPCGYSLVLPIC